MAFVIPTIYTAVDKVSAVTRAIGNSIHSLAERASLNGVRAERGLSKIGSAADGVFNKIVNLKSALAVGFVIGGAKKLFDITAEAAAFGDELSTTAQRLGMTTQAYQELGYAAKLQNIEQETLTKSFEKLNKNLGDLHTNQGTLESKLKKSNPALLAQLKHAKDSEAAFNILSGAINKLPNQMDKASLAQAAFGKSGQQMLNLISVGSPTIMKMREEAQKLGFVLSDDAVKAASKFDDAHDRMNFTLLGLKTTLGAGLMPVIGGYITMATNWVMTHRELIQQKVTEYVGKIKDAIIFLSTHISQIITGIKLFIGGLVILKASAIGSAMSIYGLRAATWLLNVALGVSNALQNKSAFYLMENTVAYAAYRAVVVTGTAATWLATAATTAWGLAMNIGLLPLTLIIVGVGLLIALIYSVVRHIKGWGAQWQNITAAMLAAFEVFKYALLLGWNIIKYTFMSMVDTIVLAWKYGQNLIGNISDEQYKKDRANILASQQLREKAINDNVKLLKEAHEKSANTNFDWKLGWKTPEDIKAEEAESNRTTSVNPKAVQNQMMQFMVTGQRKDAVELTIKDQTGKAEVTKNPNNIPIKLTPNVGAF